jgi:hypothetical protein
MDLNNESFILDDDYESGGIEENSLVIIKKRKHLKRMREES